MNIVRAVKHLLVPQWWVRRTFTPEILRDIESAIAATESLHHSELRFVVEGGLPPHYLWRGATPRERATDVFSELRVWDTEQNSGIVIYVQWIDHAVEILADRGIASRVAQAEWDAISRTMEAAFRQGDYRAGALAAIKRASHLLAQHFPASGHNPNELSDTPLVI